MPPTYGASVIMPLQRLVLALAASAILIASTSIAADATQANESPAANLPKYGRVIRSVMNMTPESPVLRREAAASIHAYCGWISDLVPTLSPKEEDWLRGEMKASPERFFAATETAEYSKNFLSERIKLCLKDANLIEAMALGDTSLAEAAYWSDLATFFTETDVGHHLKRLVDRDIVTMDRIDLQGVQLLPSVATEILAKYLTPYLIVKAAKNR